jgi:ABC-type Fe3+-siderophore transport system permease subunit
MANSSTAAHSHEGELRHDRRANPMGAYVATAGVVVFLIATFLDWVSTDDGSKTGSGYETDTTIPLVAYLGLGLVAALLYALNRARGRQHRGLSLTTMAAGIAAAGLALSYIVNVPGALERGSDYSAEVGTWIGLVGAIVWTVGAYLLAKEPEGDDDWHGTERTESTGHSAH